MPPSSLGEILMRVDGQQKYRALSRRLRDAGRGDLRRELNRAVRREGRPALNDVKAAWLGVQVTESSRGGTAYPDRSTGLRRRVSAATKISVLQTGIRIRIDGKQVDPAYGRSLAWYLNSYPRRRRWRHPVFGRRANPQDWQEQRGEEVFFRTLNRHGRQWRSGIERAMQDIARRIEG
jgi:hypothetical protein